MRSPSAIGVDDDLTTGQTGIALRAANNEPSGWLNLSEIALMVSVSGEQNEEDRFSLT